MLTTVAAGSLRHAAGMKPKTLMSCLVTHQKAPCLNQRDGMRSLEALTILLFWHTTCLSGRHCERILQRLRKIQTKLPGIPLPFICFGKFTSSEKRDGSTIFCSRTSCKSEADEQNRLPKCAREILDVIEENLWLMLSA